jgi:hypothetical protein
MADLCRPAIAQGIHRRVHSLPADKLEIGVLHLDRQFIAGRMAVGNGHGNPVDRKSGTPGKVVPEPIGLHIHHDTQVQIDKEHPLIAGGQGQDFNLKGTAGLFRPVVLE